MLRQQYRRLIFRLRDWTPVSDVQSAWQRARRGYAKRDAWSFDSYLAPVIVGAIDELLRQGHGHPMNTKDVDEWHGILRRIRDGFSTYSDGEEWTDPKVQESMALFARWFSHLWD